MNHVEESIEITLSVLKSYEVGYVVLERSLYRKMFQDHAAFYILGRKYRITPGESSKVIYKSNDQWTEVPLVEVTFPDPHFVSKVKVFTGTCPAAMLE